MSDVQEIIVITNSVPLPDLVAHDYRYNDTMLGATCGNNGIAECLRNDTEKKVSTWIFGRYPGDMDININNVRYVNNPGKDKNPKIYYPKIITI